MLQSLPSRGAWIETQIVALYIAARVDERRSLHGERGLKLPTGMTARNIIRRSLHGERGLKPRSMRDDIIASASLPSRGAWIETVLACRSASLSGRSLHGERGLKRAANIQLNETQVAPFTGSVD